MSSESARSADQSPLVVQAVAEALGVRPDAIVAAATLFDLPGFDSLTVVAILSRLEDEFGTEVPPDAIVPEAFESLGALTALFRANGGQT